MTGLWVSALVAAAPLGAAEEPGRAMAGVPASAQLRVSWASAYERGDFQLAAALLESVPERSRTAWEWLHLGRVQEKLSQLVESVAAYERVRDLVPTWDTTPAIRQAREAADAESAEVARRIPWAEIQLGDVVPAGAYVFVDSTWLDPGRLRSPYPVNPGWHTFLLELDGRVLGARRVHFEEGQQRVVSLAERELSGAVAGAARAIPTADAVGPAPLRSRPMTSVAPEDVGPSRWRVASYVTLAAGGIGLAVGAGFALQAIERRNQIIEIGSCSSGICVGPDDRVQRLRDELGTATTVSNVSLGFGVLAFASGGLMFLLSDDDAPDDSASGDLRPLIGIGSAGVAGRF